ncbi:nuclear transport factor 2-like [Typha latifolia]|uniref:nuclear transport factor 2-like n=1 Tax=Typha latifolia TaxID=4733 RepID=UPI003C2E5C5F
MALQAATPVPPPSPQVVGNAFVQQYYHVLHRSPEQVYKFYHDSSILGRPDSEGIMTSVSTMEAINDKILSLDFSNCFTEIETADSQLSYRNGVFILVTGSLTGTDNVRRKFTQSFFLAPQETGGFFVLNDVFRFVTEGQPRDINQMVVNEINGDPPVVPLTSDPEPALLKEHHVSDIPVAVSEVDVENSEQIISPSQTGGSGVEDEIAVDPIVHVNHENAEQVSEVVPLVQEEVPKKSYASIVKVMKGCPNKAKTATASTEKPVLVPSNKVNTATASTEKPVIVSVKPAHTTETTAASGTNGSENGNYNDVEGHSVYIRNLPLNATAEQVEEEFQRFGPIKPGGVQVRSHKIERFCFGFVEFESLESMQAAIEASPVDFGGRQAFVEEKRTTTRVINGVVTQSGNGSSGRGRFQQGRGGFRSENFRGRGNFTNNIGYKRSEFRNRVDYSGRGRAAPTRVIDGYQPRPFPSGNGRFGRFNGPSQTAVSA